MSITHGDLARLADRFNDLRETVDLAPGRLETEVAMAELNGFALALYDLGLQDRVIEAARAIRRNETRD